MVEMKSTEGQLVIDRALFTELLESGEQILDGVNKLVLGLHALDARDATEEPPAPKALPAEPRVWDTTENALANYDAEQLVALRADHRAGVESAQGDHVRDALVRRLGSL